MTLQPDPLRQALWHGEFDYVDASQSADIRVAARDLEILLDEVAMLCSDQAPYLLDPRYEELLDDDEKAIAQNLREVLAQIDQLSHSGRTRWNWLT